MNEHLSDDELVLHYYAELDGSPHLADCSHCRERLRVLQASLNSLAVYEPTPVPADLATRTWQRIVEAEGIEPARALLWPAWRWWPALAAACLAVAFLAGRWSKAPDGVTAIAYLPQGQIWRAETANHFARSKLVLLETVHSNDGNAKHAQFPRERAEELLASNRLLRQTARRRGDVALAELLDELERILLEIARAPERPSPLFQASLRQRIEDQGMLFRVAVTEKQIQKSNENEATEE